MHRILSIALLFLNISLMASEPTKSEYPTGIAIYPKGTTMTFSSGRTAKNVPITIEEHMIKKAFIWHRKGEKRNIFPYDAFQAIHRGRKDVYLELHFFSPEEIFARVWKAYSFNRK